MIVLLFVATCFVAYSNGANDNFKGVASLFGSRTCSYKTAIWWATITTGTGSIAAIFLAQSLLKKFSGKGLVPDALTIQPEFLLAIALGAGATVILATLFGFPISTTHGLTGALVGAGLVAGATSGLFPRSPRLQSHRSPHKDCSQGARERWEGPAVVWAKGSTPK